MNKKLGEKCVIHTLKRQTQEVKMTKKIPKDNSKSQERNVQGKDNNKLKPHKVTPELYNKIAEEGITPAALGDIQFLSPPGNNSGYSVKKRMEVKNVVSKRI